jgi:hypothetical protein
MLFSSSFGSWYLGLLGFTYVQPSEAAIEPELLPPLTQCYSPDAGRIWQKGNSTFLAGALTAE